MELLQKYLTKEHSSKSIGFTTEFPETLNLKNLKDKNHISKKDVMKNISTNNTDPIIEIEESCINKSNNQISSIIVEYPLLTKEKLVQLICQNKNRIVEN